jgi:RHS repeat-associated protein
LINGNSNHYKFGGHERDNETGLDYFGARYYGNWLGRFAIPDDFLKESHVGDPQSWNKYAYARNNPLRYTDPTGEKADVATSCSWDGSTCQVNITASIAIYPEGGPDISNDQMKQAAADIKSQIESAWSGSYEQDGVTYNVARTVNVQVSADEGAALKTGAQNVIALKDGNAIEPTTEKLGADSLVYPASLKGGPDRGVWNINSIHFKGMPIHEFTHLLGVNDRESGGWDVSRHGQSEYDRATANDFRWALSGVLTTDRELRSGTVDYGVRQNQTLQYSVGAPTRFGWWK